MASTKRAPIADDESNSVTAVELVTIQSTSDSEIKQPDEVLQIETLPQNHNITAPKLKKRKYIKCCKPDCCCYNDWDTLPVVNPCCATKDRPCCLKGESCMERFFEGIGVEVAKRPWLSMVMSFLVAVGLGSGYAFVESENRPDKLWIPTGSPALYHKDYVDENWPSSQRFSFWIATCADVAEGENCNILEAKYIDELNRIDREIKSIQINSSYALELEGVDEDVVVPYESFYSFEGDENNEIGNLCFLLGSTGAVCSEASMLSTFRYDIPNDLSDQEALDTINFYSTQLVFCPLTISDPTSPCRNTTAYNAAAGENDCQMYDSDVKMDNCHMSFNEYCNDKCPNWLSSNDTLRDMDCEEMSCPRSSWYLYSTDPPPTFVVEPGSMMSSGADGPTYEGKNVVSAEALFGFYALASETIVVDGTEFDPVSDEWEKAALCKLGIVADASDEFFNEETCLSSSNLLQFTAQFSRSLGDEFGSEIQGDLPKIGGSFAIVIAYLIIMLSRRDYVHSMIGMSIVCVLTVGLSYVGCIGFGTFVGWKNNNLNLNIPFLLLGLGVDDAFVISSEYFRAMELYPTMPPQQRTVFAAKYGGVSVLITSATDALAFLVGSSTVLPALSWFCAFCGVGIILCFMLQIFLFLPALQVNAMRADANYYDLWCCCKSKRVHKYSKPLGCCGCCKPQWCPTGVLSRLMVSVAQGLTSVAGSIVSFILFGGLLSAGIYGCTKLYKDFQLEWFVPEGSYLGDFYDQNANYFASGVSFNVYTKEMDYFDAQESFVNLHSRLVSDPYMDIEDGVSDWHNSFMEDSMSQNTTWPLMDCFDILTRQHVSLVENVLYSADDVYCLYTNRTEFYQNLMEWFEEGGWNLLSSNLKWVDAECNVCEGSCAIDPLNPGCNYQAGLSSTRVGGTLSLDATTGGQERYDTMTAARSMVAEVFPTFDENGDLVAGGTGEYNDDELAFPYSFDFPNWEEVGTIDSELFKNLAICCAVIVVIVFILIPKPRVAIFVIISIVMSIVDVLGFLYFWDITISGVSTIFILISVGLAVDYSAHIAHMFAESHGTARNRAVSALGRIGPSVFNAIMSTLLAVIVLATSSSYIYVVFFKVLCLTVLFAGAHGIWFLPVLLAWVGGDNLEVTDSKANKLKVLDSKQQNADSDTKRNEGDNVLSKIDRDMGKLEEAEEGRIVQRSTMTA